MNLASVATKKAVLYRFDREPLAGFVDSTLTLEGNNLPLLLPTGALQSVPLEQIKSICWVREWTESKPWTRSNYSVRPRQQGLWIRIEFLDGEQLEATMANSISALDPIALSISPPELAPSVQRVLIPRSAIRGFEILGVIGSSLSKPKRTPLTGSQLRMFD